MPFIDKNSPVPFYQQLYQQIVDDIKGGAYPAGKKLPSIRQTARELGVSNTTVELAYQRLCEEGFADARRGSGFVVTQTTRANGQHPSSASMYSSAYQRDLEELLSTSGKLRTPARTALYDFAYDSVDPTTFPFALWARVTRDVLFSDSAQEACLYNERQGLLALRSELARYLKSEYGVAAVPEQIVIGPTTRELIMGVIELFDRDKLVVAIEDPGYNEAHEVLKRNGVKTVSLSTYPVPSWRSIKRQITGAKLVFLTPAGQFPTNTTMNLELRKHFIEWTQQNDAYLFDDEYGFEFQHGATHISPLAALDKNGRSILLGTFSNIFTPALCMSWAVLPPKLATKWLEAEHHLHPRVPWHTQKAMAELMRQDKLYAHIRKLRTNSMSKLETLRRAIERYMGDEVDVLNYGAAPYILIATKDGRSEDELIEAAARRDVRVYPTLCYWRESAPKNWNYVLIGFARIPHAKITMGIKELAIAWGVSQ